jgi:RNA polymerase sigma factor (sigma-70 family)
MISTADEDLRDVRRVLAGDHEAFAALVDRHQGRLASYLRRCVGVHDADDLLQDTLLRAYQALARYDPTYPFRGWLLVIASRLASNHRAKWRPQASTGSEEPASLQDPAAALTQADEITQLQRRLDAALLCLPMDARALYELRFRQELSIDELAHHFAISPGAMKVRIHRLRQALSARLGLTLPEQE